MRVSVQYPVAIAWTLVGSVLAAQPGITGPSSGTVTRDYPVVDIDVNGPTFRQVLPFDVPFLIKGSAPTGVSDLLVRVAVTQDRVTGDSMKLPLACRTRAQWSEPVAWSRSSNNAGGASDFYLLLDPLTVNRYYQFCVSSIATIATEDRRKIRERAFDVLDRSVRDAPEGSWTFGAADTLRLRLIDDLRRMTGADTVIATNSLFDRNLPRDEAFSRMKPLFEGDIKDAQRNRNLAVADWKHEHVPEYQRTLTAALGQAQNPLLLAVMAHLVVEAEGNAGLKRIMGAADLRRSLDLLNPSSTLLDRLALGRRVPADGGPDVDLAKAYKPDDAAAVRANYVAQREAFQALLRFIQRLGDPAFPEHLYLDSLVTKKRITEAQAQAFVSLGSTDGRLALAIDETGQMVRTVDEVVAHLTERHNGIEALASQFEVSAERARIGRSSSTGNLSLFRAWYFSADAGFAYLAGVGATAPYLGTNIYLRPVNRDAGLQGWDWGRRFALTLGVTLSGVSETGKREDLFAGRSLLLGMGVRLTEVFRIGFGGAVFKAHDPNPLRGGTSPAVSPYAAASLDINVQDIPGLKEIFK